MEMLEQLLFIAVSVIAGASVVMKGIAMVTKITPTTRDDEIVGKVQGFLLWLQRMLDGLAVNTHSTEEQEKIKQVKKVK